MGASAQVIKPFTYSQPELSQELIDYYNTSLTKTYMQILKILHQTPHIPQKVLAVSANTTPTSLSNLLTRFTNIEPPLLNIEKSGRTKYYSLTPIGKSYVTHELLENEVTPNEESQNEESKIHTFTRESDSDPLLSETISVFSQFKNLAGDTWYILMDDLITERRQNVSVSLNYLYQMFIKNILEIARQNDQNALRQIDFMLNEPILTQRLKEHIEKVLGNYFALKPLFLLARDNEKAAFRIIDDIFTQIAWDTYGTSASTPSVYYKDYMTESEYHKTFYIITLMLNDAKSTKDDKHTLISKWESEYQDTNVCLLYIAEKCFTVLRFRK